MKTFYTLVTLLCMVTLLSAQTETWPAEQDGIRMTPVSHASLILEWNGVTLYIDPAGGATKFKSFPNPDFVIISHPHGDHMDPKTLQGLDLAHAELIAPQSVVDELGGIPFHLVTSMDNTGGVNRNGIRIEAVPMYNLPQDADAIHKKGWGNGYVITLGGKRIYVSGDTEDIPEMRSLSQIDYAFVCMNLPYTMTVSQAADAVLEFKPRVVYPYHYRGNDGLSDVKLFKTLVSENMNIDVRLRDWYAQ